MITRIFYGVGVGMAWGLSLIIMGMLTRFMVELFLIGRRWLP